MSAPVLPPAPSGQPSPLIRARDTQAQLDVTPSVPPNRTPSIPSSLRPGSHPPSLTSILSVSSSIVAHFPGYDDDSWSTTSGSESLSRTSTAPSEIAENGQPLNTLASNAIAVVSRTLCGRLVRRPLGKDTMWGAGLAAVATSAP